MLQNFSTAYTTTFGVFMNKNKWNRLTPEQQNAITEISLAWAVKHGEAWDESDKAGMAFFKEKGGVVIPQSEEEAEKWREAARPVLDNYIKKVSKKGVDGKAVVDFIKSNM
jgi:TRAP-type C4-dicarboxylate transport system substrate-binding protein